MPSRPNGGQHSKWLKRHLELSTLSSQSLWHTYHTPPLTCRSSCPGSHTSAPLKNLNLQATPTMGQTDLKTTSSRLSRSTRCMPLNTLAHAWHLAISYVHSTGRHAGLAAYLHIKSTVSDHLCCPAKAQHHKRQYAAICHACMLAQHHDVGRFALFTRP